MEQKFKLFAGVLLGVVLLGILVYQLYFTPTHQKELKLSDFPEVFQRKHSDHNRR